MDLKDIHRASKGTQQPRLLGGESLGSSSQVHASSSSRNISHHLLPSLVHSNSSPEFYTPLFQVSSAMESSLGHG